MHSPIISTPLWLSTTKHGHQGTLGPFGRSSTVHQQDLAMQLLFDAFRPFHECSWVESRFRLSVAPFEAREDADLPDRARGTVSFPAMRRGNMGLCVATIARYAKPENPLPGWNSPNKPGRKPRTIGLVSNYGIAKRTRSINNTSDLDAHFTGLGNQSFQNTPWLCSKSWRCHFNCIHGYLEILHKRTTRHRPCPLWAKNYLSVLTPPEESVPKEKYSLKKFKN